MSNFYSLLKRPADKIFLSVILSIFYSQNTWTLRVSKKLVKMSYIEYLPMKLRSREIHLSKLSHLPILPMKYIVFAHNMIYTLYFLDIHTIYLLTSNAYCR